MKFSLVFLGLFAIATAAPPAVRRAEHAAAAVVGGRDIYNGDMMRRTANHAVRANDNSIKRNPGRKGQAGEVIEMAAAIVDLVDTIIGAINKNNTLRDQFTINTVAQSKQKWPGFNWVICHTDHTTAFDGVENTDWGHSHHELGHIFGSVGYDLYWFKSGTFTRKGDGGYINWAYQGSVTGTENDGSVVHFRQP